MGAGDVDGAEGVVRDEHAYARLGAFAQYPPEDLGHPSRRAVVQLQRDRLLRRPQVVPSTWIGLSPFSVTSTRLPGRATRR